MNKKEQFKLFARMHPELVTYIKNGSMTWQNFFEIYDIYGEDEVAWKDYLTPKNTVKTEDLSSSFQNKLKQIDMNSIQEHIKTAQKALSLVSELTGKTPNPTSTVVPKVPKPINQFFED